MKRIICVLLTLCLIFSVVITVSADNLREPFEWVQVESYDDISCSDSRFGVYSLPGGVKYLQYSAAGCYVKYGAYNFTESPAGVEVMLATNKTDMAMEIRVDNPVSGKLLSKVEVSAPSGNWYKALTYSESIETEVSGIRDVYLVWKGQANFMGMRFVPNTSLKIKTLSSVDKINKSAGYLEIGFNNFINESTAEGNVLFTDSSGQQPSDLKMIVNGKKILLIFDELNEDETYSLTVTDGLKSNNGYECVPETKYFEVAADESHIIDLSQFNENENLPLENDFVCVSSDVKNDNSSAFVIAENGYKLLRLKAAGSGVSDIRLKLEDISASEYYELSYKVRLGTKGAALSAASKTLGHIQAPGGSIYNSTITAKINNDGSIQGYNTKVDPGEKATTEGELKYSGTDSNGFTDVRLIIKKDTEMECLTVEMYDPYDDEAEPFKKWSNGSDSTRANALSEISLISLYPQKSNFDDYIDVKDICYEKKNCLKPLYNNAEKSDVDINGFEVAFNQSVDETTLTNITIKEQSTGETVPCDVALVSGRVININPLYYLGVGETYVVSLNGVKNADGAKTSESFSFVADGAELTYSFFDAGGNPVENKQEAFCLKASNNSESAFLIAMALDENGRIISISSGASGSATLNLDKKNWSLIRVFGWKNDLNKFYPIAKDLIIEK